MTQKQVTMGDVTSTESFTYDGLGRMLTATKYEGANPISDSEFAYNDIGQITDTDETYFNLSTKNIGYAYDNAGYRIQTTYPNPITVQINRTNTWDGRIDILKRGTNQIIDYEYIGSRTALRKSGLYVYYAPEYDNLGRMTKSCTYETYYPTSTITDFDYTYETDENNIETITFDHRPGDPYNQYGYDTLDRLTEADYLVGVLNQDESFGMDDLGNRTTVNLKNGDDQVYEVNDLTNRYISIDQASLEYDAAGNLTVDPNGYHYEYDYENRITRIFKLDGQNEVDVARYAYDALGRRIMKTDCVTADNTRYYYYNDQWQVLDERDNNDELKMYYVYGNYIDEALVRYGPGGAGLFYLHDHLYSPVALVNILGNPLERYEYDAYGAVTIWDGTFSYTRTASNYGNPWTFTGRQLDILDGGALHLMYYRNRYYSPEIGRFIQCDPMGYVDGMSLYQGMNGNPVDSVDALGLSVIVDLAKHSSCRKAAWEMRKVLRGLGDLSLGSIFSYPGGGNGHPWEHCVWQCKLARLTDSEHAEQQGKVKEKVDLMMVGVGNLISDKCWSKLSGSSKQEISAWICSANQYADYADNQTGRSCASPCNEQQSCGQCCAGNGVPTGTKEGDEKRPYGPYCHGRYRETMGNVAVELPPWYPQWPYSTSF